MVQGRKLIAGLVILPAALAGWYLMAIGSRNQPSVGSVSQDIMEPASGTTGADAMPSFDIARIDAANRAVLSGHAAPGAKVTLFTGKAQSGTGTANDRGEWVILLTRQLGGSTQEISAQSQSGDGPVRASDERIIATRRNGQPLLVLERPGHPTRVLQRPGEAPPVLRVDAIDYEPDGTMLVSGHAAPKSGVRLYLDNAPSGFAHAGLRGGWSLVPTGVARGAYTLRVDELDPKGGVAARIEVPFERVDPEAAAKELLGKANLASHYDNSAWQIARRLAGTGTHYAVIYGANRARPRDPSLVYPGQIFEQAEAFAE